MDPAHLYDPFIGRWEAEGKAFLPDGGVRRHYWQIHFERALEGRAIQDVWAFPSIFYGTTLRIYDPALDAWHILWSDPMRQFYTRQIGRAQGNDIVQIGKNDAGESVRWSFTEITPPSFHWIGERSRDDGKTWQLQAEFFARRIP